MGCGARFLLLAAACSGALGADLEPAEIVRRAVANDEPSGNGAALAYGFTERMRTQQLDEDGRVRSVAARTREIHMPDFVRRRDRYRKAIREIPEAFVFRLAGEETLNSRLCFVIEVAPRPGYRPVDRNSKLYTQLRGRLWIDKAEYRWVKLEAELLDTVTFGWILVRIHKGSRVRLTQEFVNNEAWLPAEMWYRASLRVGLVSLRGFEAEARYTDYRREASRPPASPSADARGRRAALSLAHFTSLLRGGKYSLRISRPGMPSIHPWKMGISPPISPRTTSVIPSAMRKVFLKPGKSPAYHWQFRGTRQARVPLLPGRLFLRNT